MTITSLFVDYVQKSRLFLYPTLGFGRGGSVTPIETYISWKGHYDVTDCKLICLYHLRNDTEFRNFEKSKLLGHPKFYDFKQVESEEGEKGVYIFDFTEAKEDWDHIVVGQYSKLSKECKKKIQDFFGNAGSNVAYIESYLYPEKYHSVYSKILAEKGDRSEMEESLRYVNELCDKPVWDLEELQITVKDLEIKKEMS